MEETRFELMVIGGGGAGYAAASTAARLGRRVALVERAELGGTCLNRGCVPSKTLIRSAEVLDTVRRADQFGVAVAAARLDYARVVARKDAIIRSFSGAGPLESLARQGITLLRGSARFLDPHRLRIGEQVYRAERFVLCTGARPRVAPLPGLAAAGYLTSDDALALTGLPRSAIIVGGGIIACEFAPLWAIFGVTVTIVAERLLPREEPEVDRTLAEEFARRGIRLVRGRAERVARQGAERVVYVRTAQGPVAVAAEMLFMATGRQPNYADLDLPAAGVVATEHGVQVDATLRTSAPHIWAAGDVTGQHMYTHAGDYAGEIAGWNAAGGSPPRQADFRVVPRPVFSFPQVGAVGLTERAAREQGRAVETAQVCYADISKAVIQGEPAGFCKLVADRDTGEILGATLVGAQAAELISLVAVAMAGRVSAYTLGDTLLPYPTLPELVRWTADQIGKHLPPAEQVRRAEGPPAHAACIDCWPERAAAQRAEEHRRSG